MEPSTWNDENQHWLAQFLLKGFGRRRKASQVFRLDCRSGSIDLFDVADVASKVHLLSEQDDGLLRSIENRASQAVDKVRKRSRDFNEGDRKHLDALVWAMIINDPYHGINKEKVREEVIAEMTQEVIEAFKLQGGTVDPTEMTIMVDRIMNHDYLSHAMNSADAEPPRILRSMGLTVYRPPNGTFFVIGESPVIAVRETSSAGPHLLNPGSQIILPLQHSCLLVYDWATPVNLITYGGAVSYEQVRSLDEDYRYVLKCPYLYGRTEESLMRTAKLSLQWLPQERSKVIQDGWRAMQSSHAEIERARNVLDLRQRMQLNGIAMNVVAEAARRRQPN